MAVKIETEPCIGGRRIVRLVTTDRHVSVPDSHDGEPVVSVGPRFMMGSPPADGRTITFPGSIADIDPDALDGIIGLSAVEYGGSFDVFNGFEVRVNSDCVLTCADGFSFEFLTGHPMSFPAFDDSLMTMNSRITPELAARRLKNPYRLGDEARERYGWVLSRVLMPKAEQAVSKGDVRALAELLETGMVSDGDVRGLLERSLRSGKTGITSMLMSEIRRRSMKG